MTDNAELFPVGKIVGFHGLRGAVKVRPATNNPQLLLDIKQAKVRLASGQEIETTLHSMQLHGRLLLVTFEEFEDRTAVENMTGAEIFARREELRPLDHDEWWVSDLVGLTVYTTEGTRLGTVSSIIDAGNQILEISSEVEGKTILVPFVKDLVPLVDIKSRRVEVLALPGLLEPQ